MTTRKKPTASLRLVEQVLTERPDQLKALVKAALEEVLQAEMTDAVGALPGQRADGRLGYRAGYYSRGLVTRIGKLELRAPRDREGRFSTELFERYQRSEKALVAALAEMYVQGVSTRKVKAITEELCGHSFSASTISQINKGLDATLKRFAERMLEEAYPYLVLDARYEKVRLDGVIRAQAVLIAIGINWEGRRNVLGVELAQRESASSWKDFLAGLKARGLTGVELVVADDHAGLRRAIVELLPQAAYQRCYVHFLRNALDYLPRQHHKHLKSTNLLERLNEEIRRRTYAVRIFPNEASCLRLVRALCAEVHENWIEDHRYLDMSLLKEQKKERLRAAA